MWVSELLFFVESRAVRILRVLGNETRKQGCNGIIYRVKVTMMGVLVAGDIGWDFPCNNAISAVIMGFILNITRLDIGF